VAAAKPVTGDFIPGMIRQRDAFIQPHRGAVADHFAIKQRDKAAFGVVVDLPANFALRIGGQIIIGAADEIPDRPHVLEPGLTDFEACG